MKYDEAYCNLLKNKLTIYEVRDLNFDETNEYDSDYSTYFCPDDKCRKELDSKTKLTVVNAKKRNYIKTPHFKDTPNTEHRKNCPYSSTVKSTIDCDTESLNSEGMKEHHFPTEFIPIRKKYPKSIHLKELDEYSEPHIIKSKASSQSNITRGKSTNKTSVLEHIVESYITNKSDKSILKSMPLSIGNLTLNYWSFFKKVRFFQDRKDLIYWGKIQRIKDYKFSFRIDFVDWVENRKVCLYIKKAIIDSYRKNKLFLEEIREIAQETETKYCFFYGIYPTLRKFENGVNEFEVYNAEVENLDHLLFRTIKE